LSQKPRIPRKEMDRERWARKVPLNLGGSMHPTRTVVNVNVLHVNVLQMGQGSLVKIAITLIDPRAQVLSVNADLNRQVPSRRSLTVPV
jgi:hypothetical protein